MEMATKNAGYTIRKYEMYRTQENGDNFYWGHYFDSKTEATRDYYTRLASKHDLPWEDEA